MLASSEDDCRVAEPCANWSSPKVAVRPYTEKRMVPEMGTRYAKGHRHSSRRPPHRCLRRLLACWYGTGLPWACWRAAQRLAVGDALGWQSEGVAGWSSRLGGRRNLGRRLGRLHLAGCWLMGFFASE